MPIDRGARAATPMSKYRTENPDFNPNLLLDTMKEWLGVRTDCRLAQRLAVGGPSISKLRHGRVPVSADLLVSMHEETGLSIRELRLLAGDLRWHTGKSAPTMLPAQVPRMLSDHARLCAEMARVRKRVSSGVALRIAAGTPGMHDALYG
ncbi:helix-turn-helix domain-containing protein [Pseudoduganella sp. R-34]